MNVEEIRKDIVNCDDKLFFNTAGASLSPNSVLKKVTDFLIEEQLMGGYAMEDKYSTEIDKFYIEAAKLLNCKPTNIAFAHNSTDAYSKALLSIDFKKDDVIITSDDDYVSNHFTIGEICSENNILFLIDACQSVGQLEVDVQKNKCDFLAVTGRKWLRGPRGTGILYVSDKVLEKKMYPLTIDGNGAVWKTESKFEVYDSAKRFELFESSRALVGNKK